MENSQFFFILKINDQLIYHLPLGWCGKAIEAVSRSSKLCRLNLWGFYVLWHMSKDNIWSAVSHGKRNHTLQWTTHHLKQQINTIIIGSHNNISSCKYITVFYWFMMSAIKPAHLRSSIGGNNYKKQGPKISNFEA